MPVLQLINQEIDIFEGQLLETGAKSEKWTKAFEAKIITAEDIENELPGIGPVIYTEKKTLTNGDLSENGEIRAAIFLFWKDETAIVSLVFNVSEIDILDTIADYSSTFSATNMLTMSPTIT